MEAAPLFGVPGPPRRRSAGTRLLSEFAPTRALVPVLPPCFPDPAQAEGAWAPTRGPRPLGTRTPTSAVPPRPPGAPARSAPVRIESAALGRARPSFEDLLVRGGHKASESTRCGRGWRGVSREGGLQSQRKAPKFEWGSNNIPREPWAHRSRPGSSRRVHTPEPALTDVGSRTPV